MAKKRKIDFGDVDPDIRRRAGRVRIPEGDYVVKILDSEEVKDEDSSRVKGYRWNCQVTVGTYKGKKLSGFTSLKPAALWSLRNLIHAAVGKNVAGRAVNFDPETLYGKIVGAAVEDNEYKRQGETIISSQINTFFPRDEVQSSEDDEEEEDEDVEDEEEDEDELEEVEVEDL